MNVSYALAEKVYEVHQLSEEETATNGNTPRLRRLLRLERKLSRLEKEAIKVESELRTLGVE